MDDDFPTSVLMSHSVSNVLLITQGWVRFIVLIRLGSTKDSSKTRNLLSFHDATVVSFDFPVFRPVNMDFLIKSTQIANARHNRRLLIIAYAGTKYRPD